MDRRRRRIELRKQGIGIRATEDRVQEPTVIEDIHLGDFAQRFGFVVAGIDGIQIQRDAQLRFWRDIGTHARQRQPVRQQEMVARYKGGWHIREAGRVDSAAIPQVRGAPRLIMRQPPGYAVT